MANASSDYKLTVTNASGSTKNFPYLGRHGVRLANAGTFTLDSIDQIASGNPDPTRRKQYRDAFYTDLAAGTITVTQAGEVFGSTAPNAVGAPNGTGVTSKEFGSGNVHRTRLTLASHAIALVDEAGVVAYGGSKVYDFPQGAILILGATTNLTVTKSSAGVNADFDGDFSIGTVTASNNATLSSTEANILPSTATPQATAGATTAKGQTTTALLAILDGTTTAIDAFLNFLVDDADHDVTGTACNLVVSGTIDLTWVNLGDY